MTFLGDGSYFNVVNIDPVRDLARAKRAQRACGRAISNGVDSYSMFLYVEGRFLTERIDAQH